MMNTQYSLRIAELGFQINFPFPLQLPAVFQPFVTEGRPEAPDITIVFHPMSVSPTADEPKMDENVYFSDGKLVQRYACKNGQSIVRIEPRDMIDPYILGIPEDFLTEYCSNGNWLATMAVERMLLSYGRIILHASAVIWRGEAYLFVAPSGGGKSTQAALWEQTGAEILNGDKVILCKQNGSWLACGSPIAGSSKIYKNKCVPVAAIMLVQKAPENRLTLVPHRETFLSLYSHAVKSSWDEAFNCRLLDIVEKIAKEIPVYRLACTPDLQAVDCAQRNLKGEDYEKEVHTF
jgi:hypothetical protein